MPIIWEWIAVFSLFGYFLPFIIDFLIMQSENETSTDMLEYDKFGTKSYQYYT
jgi:hypothetical protein